MKLGQTRVLYNVGTYPIVAVAGLGDPNSWDVCDGLNGAKENVRIAAGAGVKALLGQKVGQMTVEDLGDAQSSAEGSKLAAYKFQSYKWPESRSAEPTVSLVSDAKASDSDAWKRGNIVAESQNWSRLLMETPANLMTPTIFAKEAVARLTQRGCEVVAHDRKWAESMKMNSFLSVSNGSDQPPVFLEVTYNGGKSGDKPICLVGKGITFDSGGISIKGSAKMDEMRADMGGGAVVAGTISAIAELKMPVNVKGLIPLTENMPSGSASKPGDVVYAMNGKSICIDNTDAEGRLVLADALCYAERFGPKAILDMATLTGAIRMALGECVAGVFSTNEQLWQQLQEAGHETGDRVWRMPLYKHYNENVADYPGYDLNNIGKGKGGGSCTAAAFLREFVPKDVPWMHIDIAGVMTGCDDQSYLCAKGMTGRPLRTMVEFLQKHAN